MAIKNLGKVVPQKGIDYFTEQDIKNLNIPKNTSDLKNDSKFATETYVKNEIANAQMSGGEVDLSGYATKDEIPTKTSQLTNDSKFITSIPSEYVTETELKAKGYLTEHQDISDLARKDELHSHSNKSVLDNITQTNINNWNNKSDFSGSYADLTNKPTIPTKVSQLANDSSYASESYVTNAIANAQLGGGDTEIDLSGYATKDDLINKVDKETGKSLIADSEIERLANVTNYDDTEIKNTLNSKANASDIPTKVSQLTNDKNYLTSVPSTYKTKTENDALYQAKGNYLTSVPSEYVTETELNNKGYLTEHQDISNLATKNELHSHSNKTILDSITQTNITNWNNKSEFSGSYNDLSNKPTIPTKTSQLTNDSNFITSIPSEYITETELNAKNYLTSVPSTYKTKTENDALYQAKGTYLTSVPSEYITESELNAKGYLTKHQDISNLATKEEVSQLSEVVTSYANKKSLEIDEIFAPSPQLSGRVIETVETLEEMTDVSKKYALHGYIYECVITEVKKSYTNQLPFATDIDGSIYNGKGYKDNTRLNSSGEVKDAAGIDIDTSGKIPAKAGDKLRIQSVKTSQNYATYIYSYNDANVKQGAYKISDAVTTTKTQNIDMTLDSATFGANFTNIRFCSGDINNNTIVTINEAIEESTEIVYEWVNTGEKYEYGDFDAETCTAKDIYDYLEVLCSKYPNYITKETLGKDESGTLDCNRYVLSKHFYSAWQKDNYPKMYAFENGSTVIYATSVSPRIGDTLYTTKYIGTAYSTVTAVDTPNQTRTINGKLFTRNESKDVEPTLVYIPILADTVSSNGIVYDGNKKAIAMISSISKTSMSDNKGVNYTRYPLGDRNRNMEKPVVVTIGANEHGPQGDPKEPAIICARMMKDLCECKNLDNKLLNHLKNNVMLVIMPIINPYGFTYGDDTSTNRYGYHNYNNVNINRNYDCIGFGQETNAGNCGSYGGSENETQYFMNTLAEPKSAVGISIHALGYTSGGNDGLCHYQGNGFNSDKMEKIAENMKANYNLKFTSYGEAPQETTSKSPTYITKIGAKGGIIEMQPREGYIGESTASLHSARIMEANYTLLLEAIYMWLTDYEESI